ncbi:hypothetical protein Pelo_4436 [Pelomyxa schiedti]|nr:hypothetical protein Pelo_4436 [Pelomyxa schiedti]
MSLIQIGKGLLIVDGNYFNIALGSRNIDYDAFTKALEKRIGTTFVDKFFIDSKVTAKEKYNQLGWQYPEFTSKMSTKYAKCPNCNTRFAHKFSVQAGVDVGIAVTLLDSGAFNSDIEEEVLVAGDGDFYTAVEKTKNKYHKHIWVVYQIDSFSTRLTALAGMRAISLDEILIEIGSSPTSTLSRTPTPPSNELSPPADCMRSRNRTYLAMCEMLSNGPDYPVTFRYDSNYVPPPREPPNALNPQVQQFPPAMPLPPPLQQQQQHPFAPSQSISPQPMPMGMQMQMSMPMPIPMPLPNLMSQPQPPIGSNMIPGPYPPMAFNPQQPPINGPPPRQQGPFYPRY